MGITTYIEARYCPICGVRLRNEKRGVAPFFIEREKVCWRCGRRLEEPVAGRMGLVNLVEGSFDVRTGRRL